MNRGGRAAILAGVRSLVVVATLGLGAAVAVAQPVDPYAPAPSEAPAAPRDVEIDTAVAAGLLARARTLAENGDDATARQLAVEAVARQPAPPVDAEAGALLAEIDARLAARLPAVRVPPVVAPADLDRDLDPDPVPEVPDAPSSATRGERTMAAYGVLGGVAVGVALAGTEENGQTIAGVAIGGITGGLVGLYAARKRGDDRAGAHAIGTGVLWGGVAGALFADVVSGLEDTTADDIAVGAAIGAVGGAVIGAAMASDTLTVGDAAVIDATAGLAMLAGFQLGQVMAPPESEAFTMNATIGAMSGYVLGHVIARRVDVSPGRVAKVTALGVAGAALPWVFWKASEDPTTDDDEQAFGALSLAGLAGGVYLGVRLTRDASTAGADVDAPPALVRRGSSGAWTMGGPALAPVASPRGGRGLAVTVVGARW